jgi:thiol-disulfide isomerase/thioredoxin
MEGNVSSQNQLAEILEFMNIFFFLFFISISMFATAQDYDSAWVAKTYVERFSIDTGKNLASMKFVDEKGNLKTLEDYKGKILYIDIWTTWCGPCRLNFSRSHQLLQRLKSIYLDTSIQFINICTEESKKDWKKALKEIKPPGINLYSVDTTIYGAWKISSFPTTILIDRTGKIIAKKFTDARDAVTTDFLLYSAIKGIKPSDAIWIQYRQNKYMEKHRAYSSDAEGEDYSAWFKSLVGLFVEHYHLNQKEN